MAIPTFKQLAAATIVAQVIGLTSAAAVPLRARDGAEPGLPHASDTTSYCSWWADYDGSQTCQELLDFNWIDIKAFRRWNPTIGSDCSGLKYGNSYCVEAYNEPTPPPEEEETTTTTVASTTSKAVITTAPSTTTKAPVITTTTSAGNGVVTPEPVQGNLVNNCNKFHFVESGDSCSAIAQKYGLTVAQFASFNGLNSGCTNLWGETYACVGLIGGNPSATSAPVKTTTAPSNGVQTPEPVHSGILSNCNKFYMVKSGDSCASIAKQNNIRNANVVSWNGLNSGCTNLWLDTYACIGIIGSSPTVPQTTTTTKAGNGIQTPQPTQPGIASNCDKFHLVSDGDLCAKIANANGISVAQFAQWNTLNSGCSNLWGSVYACVHVVGFTPTPTNPGNGIQTPQPTQGSLVANCKKFEYVKSGETCDVVAKRVGITVKQMTTWNPSIGSDCTKLWANAYACVGV